MLKNYLKITFRNLYFNKTQTIIKTVGLGIALCVSIAIFSWVKFELSFDKFHKDSDRIYRLKFENKLATSPPGMKLVLDKTPGVDNAVRILNAGFLGSTFKVSHGDKVFTNDKIYYADDNFFDVFSFPLLRGDPEKVLIKKNAVVITQSTAEKYFGSENPMGKTLMLGQDNELEVTGVLKDIPANSHFHFDMLITLKNSPGWEYFNTLVFGSSWIFPTYFKISKGTDVNNVLAAVNSEVKSYKYKPENIGVQKLTDIHLHSALEMELEANGDMDYVYIFSVVGFLIIVMSCINYINLTTALSFRRSKEIGIRKTVGAAKLQLVSQFIGESIAMSVIAFIIAMLLIEFLTPLFSSIIGVKFFKGIFREPVIVGTAFLFALFIGTVTGFFPALVMSRLNVVNSFKSSLPAKSSKAKSRSLLVIFQFSISIVLIIGSLIIYNQINYVRDKKLGYNKDHVLVLNLGQGKIVSQIDVLKNSLAQNPGITSVAASSQLPTNIITSEGVDTKDGKRHGAFFMSADKEVFNTLDIKFDKGKKQVEDLLEDQNRDPKTMKNNFVVNETFLKEAGIKLDDIENQPIVLRHGNMQPGPIIGVVKDFHFESLHDPIGPLIIEFNPRSAWYNSYLLIKINSPDIPATIDFIKQKWSGVAEGLPFDYHFLDADYNALYQAEMQVGNLITVFTMVSLFIIILGLLGLIAFIANQKTKEIGIRKVLGASIGNIFLMLSKKFIAWVLIANIIAVPVAYYFMNKWLQGFAYRIDLNWWIFVLSGLIALFIALATVSFQAIKAAVANPVEALRYE